MDSRAFLEGLPLHPEQFQARPYQIQTAQQALQHKRSLVVMGTALGKTYIALLVYAALLRQNPSARCLFLAPTKPLVAQQADRVKSCLAVPGEVVVLTGEQNPEQRGRLYETAQVIVATPQAVANDVAEHRVQLSNYSLVVFDEAHRAVGDYAYVPVAQACQQLPAHVLGLTASPSSQSEKVEEVCRNLGVTEVIYKTEQDDDVAQYARPVQMEHVFVSLPPQMDNLRATVKQLYYESADRLKPWGLTAREPNRRLLLELQGRLIRNLPKTGRALSDVTRAINLAHALDLLESQGVGALQDYLTGLNNREVKSKAVAGLIADYRVAQLIQETRRLLASGFEHPKRESLRLLVQDTVAQGKSVIVFVHFRASAERVCTYLNTLPRVKACMLVGRAGERGMNQKEQVEAVAAFAEGTFNVLVCTQVGEEGLSIHSVDLVVFFEAVPSEIRLIQRRGRTGRVRAGRAVVLVTKGTRDETFLWVSRNKERKMRGVLEQVREKLSHPGNQPALSTFS